MAITFPITGVTAAYSTSRSPSFTLGESPVENDIIVAFVSVGATGSAATTDVSGWTNVLGANVEVEPGDSSMTAAMVYHRVTAAEDTANTVTWTLTNFWDATETGRISVAVLRGVATSGELVGTASASNIAVGDGTIPSVTPTADSTVIAGFAQDGTGTRTSAPTGYTDIAGGDTSAQHNYIYYRTTNATSGVATGSAAANTTTNDEYVSIVAAFQPASTTSAGTGTPTDVRDTASGAAVLTIPSSGAVTDVRDTASGSAVITSTASGAVTDVRDSASGAATAGALIPTGTGTPTDVRDTASGTASFAIDSSGSPTDVRDTASGAAVITVLASGGCVDGGEAGTESFAGTYDGGEPSTGSFDDPLDGGTPFSSPGCVVDARDTANGAATATAGVEASGAVIDTRDTTSGAASVVAADVTASGAVVDVRDTAAGIAPRSYTPGYYVIVIDPESRVVRVQADDRLMTVSSEPRSMSIAEPRTLAIDAEPRIMEVPDGA